MTAFSSLICSGSSVDAELIIACSLLSSFASERTVSLFGNLAATPISNSTLLLATVPTNGGAIDGASVVMLETDNLENAKSSPLFADFCTQRIRMNMNQKMKILTLTTRRIRMIMNQKVKILTLTTSKTT